MWLLLLAACRLECEKDCADMPEATDDTGERGGDSGETAGDSSGETDDSGGAVDSGETGDSADTSDTSDTAPPGPRYVERELDIVGVKLVGEDANSSFIGAIAVGDFDADGHSDFVLGKESSTLGVPGGGAAYVVIGPVLADLDLAYADARIAGHEIGAAAGTAVANAGDVDGDGVDDLLVGAPGPASWDSPGKAYLLTQFVTGDVTLEAATATLVGEYVDAGDATLEHGYAGGSLSGAGDVNGDGFGDVLVGAYQYDSTRGVAYLMHGPFGGVHELAHAEVRIEGAASGDALGARVASSDANGDGVADLFVSHDAVSGASLLLFAAPHPAVLGPGDADASFMDAGGEDVFLGAAAGDVDGDGYDDHWISAPQDDGVARNAGAAYLVPGPWSGGRDVTDATAALLGTTESESAGMSIASVGDVDGDGVPDVLVGTSEGAGFDPGSAYLAYGPFAGTTSLEYAAYKFLGDGEDNAGSVVAAPGDADGDGLADLLISGPGDDDGGAGSGAAWIVFASSL